MEVEAARLIGAGLAAIGAGAAAAGVGYIWGSFLQGALRNPEAANGEQARLYIGFAVTELLGLIAAVIGFILLFG
ncbi:ATP synthase subunit c family protein [Parasphingopyxis marina]|uniref:ATP synthase subunit c n=1 Tax=Parasphingopyxis marina TaxID=2761622 RepID=A0A842I0P7_9SPHN|nr:F0F1 ATP synthase subunit C [Parasphingopyxis marina]MBC2778219.1 F0F1 ATP synthase subunit C [Parasphingopyxis marina]